MKKVCYDIGLYPNAVQNFILNNFSTSNMFNPYTGEKTDRKCFITDFHSEDDWRIKEFMFKLNNPNLPIPPRQ